jgi:hypothetical protein
MRDKQVDGAFYIPDIDLPKTADDCDVDRMATRGR